MSWASVILSGISLLNSLMKWAMEKQAIRTGEERQIAKATMELLEMTREGKELRERIKQLSDDDSADLWDRMVNK